jgi:hypothetical protein
MKDELTGIDRDEQDKENAIKHSCLNAFCFYPDNLCPSLLISPSFGCAVRICGINLSSFIIIIREIILK